MVYTTQPVVLIINLIPIGDYTLKKGTTGYNAPKWRKLTIFDFYESVLGAQGVNLQDRLNAYLC